MRAQCVAFAGLLSLVLWAAAVFAQSGPQVADETDAVRRDRLQKTLRSMEKVFDEQMAELRAEFETRIKKQQQEMSELLGKRHMEFARRVDDLKNREKSIEKTAESKKKGYFVRVEIKGQLIKRIGESQNPFFPTEINEIPMWWEIVSGDTEFTLDLKNDEQRKRAEANANRTAIVTGVVHSKGVLEVKSLEILAE